MSSSNKNIFLPGDLLQSKEVQTSQCEVQPRRIQSATPKIHLRNVSEKYSPQKTTIEQIYILRFQQQDQSRPLTALNRIEESVRSGVVFENNDSIVDEIHSEQQLSRRNSLVKQIQSLKQSDSQKQFYYSHVNEIRSIKEFMYLIDKLNRKNIEKKVQERVQLQKKVLKIKEIEVLHKLQYQLEVRIRQFIKDNEQAQIQDPNVANFEHFLQSIEDDEKLKDIPIQQMQAEFIRIKNTILINQDEEEDKERLQISKASHSHIKINTTRNIDKEDDPNKLMTMKIADKLLTVMMTEESKNKRVPIINIVNDQKNVLEEQLNKPFGGKMKFTATSFSWLIENTINRSKEFIKTRKQQFKMRRLPDRKGIAKEQLFVIEDVPYPPMEMIKTIQNRVERINKVISSGVPKNNSIKPPKYLKNRQVIVQNYKIGERIKENKQFQKDINQANQRLFHSSNKLDCALVKNERYVSLFI